MRPALVLLGLLLLTTVVAPLATAYQGPPTCVRGPCWPVDLPPLRCVGELCDAINAVCALLKFGACVE